MPYRSFVVKKSMPSHSLRATVTSDRKTVNPDARRWRSTAAEKIASLSWIRNRYEWSQETASNQWVELWGQPRHHQHRHLQWHLSKCNKLVVYENIYICAEWSHDWQRSRDRGWRAKQFREFHRCPSSKLCLSVTIAVAHHNFTRAQQLRASLPTNAVRSFSRRKSHNRPGEQSPTQLFADRVRASKNQATTDFKLRTLGGAVVSVMQSPESRCVTTRPRPAARFLPVGVFLARRRWVRSSW